MAPIIDRNQEHRELMEAVISRNADRAVELMTAHLNLATQILIDALAAQANTEAVTLAGAK